MFYKVLSRNRFGNLTSSGAMGTIELIYKPGETTIAIPDLWELGFGLFVFRNLEAAHNYRSANQEVWKVHVRNVKPAPKLVYWGDPFYSINRIVANIKMSHEMDYLSQLCGSNLADMAVVKSLKLVERV